MLLLPPTCLIDGHDNSRQHTMLGKQPITMTGAIACNPCMAWAIKGHIPATPVWLGFGISPQQDIFVRFLSPVFEMATS